MKEKFIVSRGTEKEGFKMMAVRSSTHELIQQMKDETGVPLVDLVDAMARFCAERLEVVDNK